MLKWAIMGLALGLAACTSMSQAPMGAAPGAAGADALIDRYDEVALKSITSELGYSISEKDTDNQGRPFMTVEAGGDMAFRIGGQSCEGKSKEQVCQGVQLTARFPGDPDDEKLNEIVDRVNRTLRPAKIFFIESGVAYERYLIMDGGVSRENLKVNIEVFVEILEAILKQI
jgi:Putative bacterial sensory transduction regulator